MRVMSGGLQSVLQAAGGAADLFHKLLCRFLHRPGFLSHLRSFNGYDGPEILPSSTRPFCLIGADAEQARQGYSIAAKFQAVSLKAPIVGAGALFKMQSKGQPSRQNGR
jgi:hypothetical protein